MPGVNSLLNLGQTGLFASQSSIQTVGNNIANVNTIGYRRRTVRLEEAMSINFAPGQIGTGVRAAEVVRSFDRFIENTFNDKSSSSSRWSTIYQEMRSLDSLFNEANLDGMNAAMSSFFGAWNDLAANPASYPARETLLSQTKSILTLLNSADEQMTALQRQADNYIQQDVTRANGILRSIATFNRQINEQQVDGVNNVNELYDQRDLLTRELATIIDINVIDKGAGNITITTKAGQTLVDRESHFHLSFENAKSFKNLTPASNFDGQIYFSGSDEYEYTFEVVSGGQVSNGGSAALMRVSLDGGKTWLRDENGDELRVSARPEDGAVAVRNLTVWFGTGNDSGGTPANNLRAGDSFTIVPKKALYWYQTASNPENITPQIGLDGKDNERRIVGGSLGGYFNFRDDYIGKYRDKLDAFAESLIWEVNRIHSQGAGLVHHDAVVGTYSVRSDSMALGTPESGLAFGDKLAAGSTMIHVYDKTSGEYVTGAALDFSSGAGQLNFDPSLHSLEDVRDAINRTFSGVLRAEISNHQLTITSADGTTQFEFGEDTTGLWAALGVNTFFDGSNARSVSLNSSLSQNLGHVNTGHVNGAGETNKGDNTTALTMTKLEAKRVSISTIHSGSISETLSSFYNSLVAEVGGDTKIAQFNFAYQKALADDLDRRQQEISGVNLDQEMSDLIRFQHSYTAAAKLITTADQMIQTLLGLKQ